MVLIIGDEEVSGLRGDDLFEKFPCLRVASEDLVEEGLREVTIEEKCVYVSQREMVVVKPEDEVEVVGSEEATTCHICVLREPTSGTTGLAHLDCDDPAQLETLEREVRRRCQEVHTPRYEVTLIGGFQDDRGTSLEITNTLLTVMSSSTAIYNLVVAVIGEVNTEVRLGVSWPKVYGGGVVISSGQVFCGTFQYHGPQPDIRSLLTQGVETLHNIFHPESGDIVLHYQPYRILRNPQFWIDQSDEFILRHLSTSPLVEPPDFCENMRDSFKRMISDPRPLETLFPAGQSRRYRRDLSSGEWRFLQFM